MYEIKKVGRLSILESFVSEDCNFEIDPLFDRKPVKFDQCRCNVMAASNRWNDYTCKGVLDKLKTV